MLQQIDVTIDQIDEASEALNTVMEEAMNVMVRLSDRYKAQKDSTNCEKLSSEIEQIEVEFTDAQNRAQNVRDELSAEVVHSKFVDGLYKEQQLLADKFNVNILPVQGDSREPYTMLNSRSSACEIIDQQSSKCSDQQSTKQSDQQFVLQSSRPFHSPGIFSRTRSETHPVNQKCDKSSSNAVLCEQSTTSSNWCCKSA